VYVFRRLKLWKEVCIVHSEGCVILQRKNVFCYRASRTVNSVVKFEAFTAVTVKNAVFWSVTSCGSSKVWHFGGTHRFHFQGKNSATQEKSFSFGVVLQLLVLLTLFLARCIFPLWLEMEAILLRNVGSYDSHMASHSRRRHSSRVVSFL
jgi:hypothetical protein